MKKNTSIWLEQSSYDLETANAMQRTGRYLYVAFMCQQAVEKQLKAMICGKTDKMPPYIHNLVRLSEHLNLDLNEKQMDHLDLLSSYYINSRYPVVKQKLASSLDKEECERLLKNTKGIIEWLRKK